MIYDKDGINPDDLDFDLQEGYYLVKQGEYASEEYAFHSGDNCSWVSRDLTSLRTWDLVQIDVASHTRNHLHGWPEQ